MRTWTREEVAGFLEQLAAAAQPPALPPHRLHRHAARRVAESSVVGCSLEHQHDLRSNPGGADGGGRQGVRWTTWRNPPSRGLAAGRLRSTTRSSTSFSGTARRKSSSGRAPSSVSREVARNGGPRRYRARAPDVAAYCRARRPKPSKLVLVPRLGRSSRTVWRIAGRPSRSRRGYVERIPATSRCGCHTTPSISASSCRPAARSAATRHSAITGRRR